MREHDWKWDKHNPLGEPNVCGACGARANGFNNFARDCPGRPASLHEQMLGQTGANTRGASTLDGQRPAPPRETPEDRSKPKTWTLGGAPAEPPAAAEMDPNHAWWQEQAIKAQAKAGSMAAAEIVGMIMADERTATLNEVMQHVYGRKPPAPESEQWTMDDVLEAHEQESARIRQEAEAAERERLAGLIEGMVGRFGGDWRHAHEEDVAAWLRAGGKGEP